MGNGPLERENDSPIFDASSGSGGSLDSLDDFSTSQAHRSKLNESLGGVIKEPKQPFLGQDGRLEGLVGLDQLGVPKGFLGDRVKNYYSWCDQQSRTEFCTVNMVYVSYTVLTI